LSEKENSGIAWIGVEILVAFNYESGYARRKEASLQQERVMIVTSWVIFNAK